MGLNKRNVVNKIDIVLLVMLLLIVTQNFFEQIITWWSFFDECLVVLVCLSALAVRAYNGNWRVSRYYLVFGLFVVVYLLLGTISSIMGGYQSLSISMAGAFLSVKWFLLFLGMQSVYRYWPKIQVGNWDKKVLYIVIIILTITENLYYTGLIDNWMLAPIQLCATSVFLIGLLFLKWERKKLDYVGIILLIENLVLSSKAKGYAAAFLAVALLYWIIYKHKKITVFLITLLGIGCVIVAWDKIYFYYILGANHNYARSRLFTTGIEIANDYFPIGTGWSTYGSYYAAQNYSPVYFLYGISEHHELGVLTKKFLMDAYWPIVYAESGWIGFGAIGMICLLLFYKVQKLFQIDKRLYAAGFMTFVYMMITTIEETGFAQPALMCLALLMGIVFAEGDERKRTYENSK